MGGYSDDDQKPKRSGRRKLVEGSADPCAVDLEIDLVGLQPDVSGLLKRGDALKVAVVAQETARSVVCQTTRAQVVGSLAAFRGLAQLIACLEAGARYQAIVILASRTRCSVQISRVQ